MNTIPAPIYFDDEWPHSRVRVIAAVNLQPFEGQDSPDNVPAGTRGWAYPNRGQWKVQFDNGARWTVSSAGPLWGRGVNVMGPEAQPHIPTFSEVAWMRQELKDADESPLVLRAIEGDR